MDAASADAAACFEAELKKFVDFVLSFPRGRRARLTDEQAAQRDSMFAELNARAIDVMKLLEVGMDAEFAALEASEAGNALIAWPSSDTGAADQTVLFPPPDWCQKGVAIPEGSEAPQNYWNNYGHHVYLSLLLGKAAAVDPVFQAKALDVFALGTGVECRSAPRKTHIRASEKLRNDYDDDAGRIVDFVRCMVVCADAEQLLRAKDALDANFDVVRVKNRFAVEDPAFGYRDVLCNVVCDDMVCEVQLTLAPFLAIREKMHGPYSIAREPGVFECVTCILQKNAYHGIQELHI